MSSDAASSGHGEAAGGGADGDRLVGLVEVVLGGVEVEGGAARGRAGGDGAGEIGHRDEVGALGGGARADADRDGLVLGEGGRAAEGGGGGDAGRGTPLSRLTAPKRSGIWHHGL